MLFSVLLSNLNRTISDTYIVEKLQEYLAKMYVPESWLPIVRDSIMLAVLLSICFVSFYIARFVIVRIIKQFVKNTKAEWDDILFSQKFLTRLSYVVPASLVIKLLPYTLPYSPGWTSLILSFANIYIVFILLLALFALISNFNEIYNSWEIAAYKPIKGYLQLIKIILSIIAAILIIAFLIGKSPLIFLTGLGALSAVMMLVFKDALLGLVAGVQLSANDMVRPGDWISMPKYQADGDVIDITLTTVKVQNFDRTIVYIPAYIMISDSFVNWRGMADSKERRIKRALHIDVNSVIFCTDEMLERFKKYSLVKDYVESKQQEIQEHNKSKAVDTTVIINGRRQTNLGIFRAYTEAYLKSLHTINNESIMMVRQLQPAETGIPLEVYAFASDNNWVNYEKIQSDIFDHLLAALPNFDLKLYQSPAGNDIKELKKLSNPS